MPRYNAKWTARERLFCKRYLANDYNASEAARFAGYKESASSNIGSRMLGKVHIQEYIEKSVRKIEKKLEITIEKKIEALWLIAQGGIPKNGEQVSASTAVSAIAELNKLQGHYPKETKADDKETEKRIETAVNEVKEY